MGIVRARGEKSILGASWSWRGRLPARRHVSLEERGSWNEKAGCLGGGLAKIPNIWGVPDCFLEAGVFEGLSRVKRGDLPQRDPRADRRV